VAPTSNRVFGVCNSGFMRDYVRPEATGSGQCRMQSVPSSNIGAKCIQVSEIQFPGNPTAGRRRFPPQRRWHRNPPTCSIPALRLAAEKKSIRRFTGGRGGRRDQTGGRIPLRSRRPPVRGLDGPSRLPATATRGQPKGVMSCIETEADGRAAAKGSRVPRQSAPPSLSPTRRLADATLQSRLISIHDMTPFQALKFILSATLDL